MPITTLGNNNDDHFSCGSGRTTISSSPFKEQSLAVQQQQLINENADVIRIVDTHSNKQHTLCNTHKSSSFRAKGVERFQVVARKVCFYLFEIQPAGQRLEIRVAQQQANKKDDCKIHGRTNEGERAHDPPR